MVKIITQKVICIDDQFHDNKNYLHKISINEILVCLGTEAMPMTGYVYYIMVNDKKEYYHVITKDFEKYFKLLSEFREERINSILND